MPTHERLHHSYKSTGDTDEQAFVRSYCLSSINNGRYASAILAQGTKFRHKGMPSFHAMQLHLTERDPVGSSSGRFSWPHPSNDRL